jgi:glycosyltransferase involved in cell wall biosynthesis
MLAREPALDSRCVLLIPAYNPDERLIQLVEELQSLSAGGMTILVVDDGTVPSLQWIFEKLRTCYRCECIRHDKNRGKGAALKTGIKHILEKYPNAKGMVSADADLQHLPRDILRIAETLEENPGSFILGSRRFNGKRVPFKSKWGNQITSSVVYLLTGIPNLDTQTGLRGIPSKYAGTCAGIRGDHFEYEMEVLLLMAAKQVPFIKVPVTTVYTEGNRSTSFHAIRDSLLIYRNILKFGASSLISAGLDLVLFALLSTLVFGKTAGGIMAATVAARIGSGLCNFTLNRLLVFKSRGSALDRGIKYLILFIVVMLASGAITGLLSSMGFPSLAAKVLTDSFLFVLSYAVQRRLIFT